MDKFSRKSWQRCNSEIIEDFGFRRLYRDDRCDGCQREIVKEIVKKEADYVISLKGDQSILYEDVADYLYWAEREKFNIMNPKIWFFRTFGASLGKKT